MVPSDISDEDIQGSNLFYPAVTIKLLHAKIHPNIWHFTYKINKNWKKEKKKKTSIKVNIGFNI